MPETIPAEAVPFTPERAALVRASHCAEALAALLEAKVTEHDDPTAGPVFVGAVEAFELNPADEFCPAAESRWELALATLVGAGVAPLEVEALAWPLEGGEVCRLSARLRRDMTAEDLANLSRWTLDARELARLRLLDGLSYCDHLAGEIAPEAPHAAEVSACGGALLRCVRELVERVSESPDAFAMPPEARRALLARIDRHAERLAKSAHGVSEGAALPLVAYVTECLALLDRVPPLLDHLPPTLPAPAAGASA